MREGKPTLPLIYLMQNGTPDQRELVRACIESGDEQHFDEILAAITTCGALDYTKSEAEKAARRATASISGLPNGQFKDSLLNLSAFAVDRNY